MEADQNIIGGGGGGVRSKEEEQRINIVFDICLIVLSYIYFPLFPFFFHGGGSKNYGGGVKIL